MRQNAARKPDDAPPAPPAPDYGAQAQSDVDRAFGSPARLAVLKPFAHDYGAALVTARQAALVALSAVKRIEQNAAAARARLDDARPRRDVILADAAAGHVIDAAALADCDAVIREAEAVTVAYAAALGPAQANFTNASRVQAAVVNGYIARRSAAYQSRQAELERLAQEAIARVRESSEVTMTAARYSLGDDKAIHRMLGA